MKPMPQVFWTLDVVKQTGSFTIQSWVSSKYVGYQSPVEKIRSDWIVWRIFIFNKAEV